MLFEKASSVLFYNRIEMFVRRSKRIPRMNRCVFCCHSIGSGKGEYGKKYLGRQGVERHVE